MKYRVERLENEILRNIDQIIIRDINDPNLENITITEVDLSNDLKNAKIFYSFLGDKASTAEKIRKSFSRATKRIRYLLSQKIEMRQVPKLTFIHDSSFAYADKINNILNNLKENNND